MAARKNPESLTDDALPSRLIDENGDRIEFVTFAGYYKRVGRSAGRLYLDPSLTSYIQFRTNSVLLAQKVELPPFGATRVWLKADAEIESVTRTKKGKSAAKFLEGSIRKAHLRASKAVHLATGTSPTPVDTTGWCGPYLHIDPRQAYACPLTYVWSDCGRSNLGECES